MEVIIIAVIIFVIYKSVNSKDKTKETATGKQTEVNAKRKYQKREDNELYKKKDYRTFTLKGISHRDEDVLMRSLSFYGYAECEDNNWHDSYAVAIYNGHNEKVGYVTKGNKKLYDSLKEWHNGKVICWGGIHFNDFYYKFEYRFSDAYVTLPVGFNQEELELLHEYHTKRNYRTELYHLHKNTGKPVDKGLELLHLTYEVEELMKLLPGTEFDNQSLFVSKNLIPSISNKLEKNKDWKGLIELEKFSREINELSEVKRNATLRRIEKAKAELMV